MLFLSTHVGVPALPALSTRLGADATRAAAIPSATGMTLVFLQLFGSALADRWGRRRVLIAGAALGASLPCSVLPPPPGRCSCCCAS